MKNTKKFAAALACAAMVLSLAGCSSQGSAKAKYTKVGFGMITEVNEYADYNQINTTMATVALDKDGKIAYIDLDVAQQSTNSTEELRTKMERGADYGMLKVSSSTGIGKEYNEQVQYLMESLVGMTEKEVAAIEVYEKDASHTAVPKEGTDLASGCTISIDGYQKAIQKAFDNMKTVNAEKIGAGESISVDTAKGQVNTTVASIALDSNDKIVWSSLDVAQTSSADMTKSKVERGADYGMLTVSTNTGIGKEYFEQISFLQEHIMGMTAKDVAAIEVYEKDASHTAVAKEGTDLAAGCTITINGYQAAIAEAFTEAK